ncbi:MAG: hypothetical protein Q7S57_03905 [bacterium]|nr:hypothetical protein [bacterium]
MKKWKVYKIIGVIIVVVVLLDISNPLGNWNRSINRFAVSTRSVSLCYLMIGQTTNIPHAFISFDIFGGGGVIDKETCIDDVASKLGDFAICNNHFTKPDSALGTGGLGGCYIHVTIANVHNYNGKNKGPESCSGMNDSDRKKDCIQDFAIEKKDPSICNLLSSEIINATGSPRDVCKDLVGPLPQDLQTYVNNEYGFQIDYPKDWHFALPAQTLGVTTYDFGGSRGYPIRPELCGISLVSNACPPLFAVNAPGDKVGVSLYLFDSKKASDAHQEIFKIGTFHDGANNRYYELRGTVYGAASPLDMRLKTSVWNKMVSSFKLIK